MKGRAILLCALGSTGVPHPERLIVLWVHQYEFYEGILLRLVNHLLSFLSAVAFLMVYLQDP
jgi:hypothetical protein